MAEILACRLCHVALVAEGGCAVCAAVKPHLTVSAAVDDAAVPLAQVAQEGIVTLQRQLKKLRETKEPDASARAELRAVTNAIAKLLDSSRKVIQDGADAVDAMSFQEKAALFLEWTGSLPAPYRRRLIEAMTGQNANTAQPEPDEHVRTN